MTRRTSQRWNCWPAMCCLWWRRGHRAQSKGARTMQLAGQVAVITGGASGIGRGAALAMARHGTDVVIADINDRRLEETRAAIAALGRHALTVHCDVSNDADVERLGATAL